MSTKTIPAQTIKTCDCCSVTMDGQNSRQEVKLTLNAHALDMHGHACADATRKFDLWQGVGAVHESGNDTISAKIAGVQPTEEEAKPFMGHVRVFAQRQYEAGLAEGSADRAPKSSVLEDAARLDFLIEQRAYVVSDPDACPGYWLHFVHKETGKCWVQCDEHPTPRAAIDAAMKAGGTHDNH